MSLHGIVLAAGQGPVIRRTSPGRSFTLKLQNGETAENVMMFEEVAPVGTVTDFHTHRASDEVAYVLCGEVTFKIGDEVTVGGNFRPPPAREPRFSTSRPRPHRELSPVRLWLRQPAPLRARARAEYVPSTPRA